LPPALLFKITFIRMNPIVKILNPMKNNIILMLLIIPFLITCEKDTPETLVGLSSKIEITTGSATDVSYFSAIVTGNLGKTYGHTVKDYGHCWDTLQNPEIIAGSVSLGSINTEKSFISELDNLKPGRKYYVRAYFTINDITKYSEPVSFTTFTLGLPVVETDSATNIKALTALCGGTITADGGSEVTSYGLCWNTKGNPTTDENKILIGTGTGSFTHLLSGLNNNTLYYVRVYATNSFGTSYGNEISFTTKDGLPDIITAEVTNITAVTAISGGSVADDEGFPITARGVCWNTSQNPTVQNNKSTNGSGTGTYTSELSGLQPGQVLYLRAYATNSTGTSYGNQVQFVTNDGIPDLTTTEVSNITAVIATSGGNITDDGGLPVTARGLCWSKTTNPTIANSKTSNGAGTGAFTGNLNDLEINTTYYIKSYATTQSGTGYGNQVVFKTKDGKPIISTNAVTSITSGSATSGGNITDDGGFSVLERGICWSTSPNPTIADNKISNAGSTGVFTGSITDLEPNTLYYVRAYATNQQETVYGNERSFSSGMTPGPFIEFSKYQVIGDNNGDGIINRGEKVYLRVYLKNIGTTTANEVRARISTSDINISNLNPPNNIQFDSYYSDLDYIGAGEERYGYYRNYNGHYSFDFEISKLIPYNTQVAFNVDISDKDGHSWTDTFNINVVQTNANIEFYEYEFCDATNKDGEINPGDKVYIRIYLKNTGNRANKVSAMVSTESPYIQNLAPLSWINFSDGGSGDYIGYMETRYAYNSQYSSVCGGNSYYSISFIASASTPHNTDISFNMNISDESLNNWTDSFTITVK
jgi:hypothetical protein